MSRIVVARHGDTFAPGDQIRRIGARVDLPLVASGVEQADRLGRHLAARGFAFTTVLTGKLARTRATAALVTARGVTPMTTTETDWLTEIDHGPDEGQPEDAVRDRIGQAAIDAWDRTMVPPADWIIMPEQRIAGWRELFNDPPVGDTLIVTSNGAARFAAAALGESPNAGQKLRTGAFGLIERTSRPTDPVWQRNWRVCEWNVRP